MPYYHPDDLPDDANELRAEDRRRRRICRHRSGDPDCDCYPDFDDDGGDWAASGDVYEEMDMDDAGDRS